MQARLLGPRGALVWLLSQEGERFRLLRSLRLAPALVGPPVTPREEYLQEQIGILQEYGTALREALEVAMKTARRTPELLAAINRARALLALVEYERDSLTAYEKKA